MLFMLKYIQNITLRSKTFSIRLITHQILQFDYFLPLLHRNRFTVKLSYLLSNLPNFKSGFLGCLASNILKVYQTFHVIFFSKRK